ncbi:MAG: 16S rRNA (cytosine(1402)-N(4))-methyltransferase RsmH [bacterium]
MDDSQQKHQRRPRYQGTHPTAYADKYKELDPEKYGDTVAKVLQKGNTPAGMHRPICVEEILDILQITPGETGLDATLGYGGHTQAMLERLDGRGRLFAIDADPIELPHTAERLAKLGYGPDILTVQTMNFADIDQLAATAGPFHFVLADLGVSSMQIDNPQRGFSFKAEGPLDLRMNPQKGIAAAYRLRAMTEAEIAGMLIENADEPHAAAIAQGIIAEYRQGRDIATTTQLQQVIRAALASLPKAERTEEIKKSCQRSFQALRIDVNHEYEALYAFLEKLPAILAPGGRVCVLSFHSGEDRLVKKSFQQYFREGLYREIAPEPIRPTPAEQSANSRARAAKLRWAIRV